MTLAHLFLLHRYKVDSVHFVTPTDDNQRQTERMRARGIYASVNIEIGEIIVADVVKTKVLELCGKDRSKLELMINE